MSTAVLSTVSNAAPPTLLTPIAASPVTASSGKPPKTNAGEFEAGEIEKNAPVTSNGSTGVLAPLGSNGTTNSTNISSKPHPEDSSNGATLPAVAPMGATPVLSLPNGLKLPKVSGTGLSAVDFQNLTNCNSPSELFKLLLSMDLGKVASTISLDQLTQLANQFGSDLSFQSLLNTGRLPEPISAPPSTLPRPTVKGLGLDGNSFSALLNAKDSSSLFKEISAQTLDQIASHISQTQLNQIFTKFEADPAFGNFITTGTMPKALNAVEPINTTPSHPPEVELIGTLSV